MSSDASVSGQRYARVAGVLMVLSIVFGFFGESYIPGLFIVPNDAAATAARIAAKPFLYRVGFATYLVEGICDVGLAAVFYLLLKPVSKPLALTSAFFGLVSTALYAVGEAFYLLPTIWVGHESLLTGFSTEQVNAMTLLALRVFGRIGWGFLAFYGVATFIRGYLIYRSGYLPKTLGALFMIGGAGFVAKNLTYVLAPAYSTDALLAPLAIAALITTVWLLAKGVDPDGWALRVSRAP